MRALSESCTEVIGAIAMSSWSAKPFVPFDLSTPITVQVEPPILIRCAERVRTGAEQVVDDGLAEDHDLAVLGDVVVGERRATRDLEVPDREVVRRRAHALRDRVRGALVGRGRVSR